MARLNRLYEITFITLAKDNLLNCLEKLNNNREKRDLFKNYVASGGNFITDIADDINEFVDYLL